MKNIKEIITNFPEIVILSIPIVMYFGYKLALEMWCIAYGLIY